MYPRSARGARRPARTVAPQPPELPPFNEPWAEQMFLARHHDESAKKPHRNPHSAFRTPSQAVVELVSPFDNASLALSAVERTLAAEMDGESPASA
jgi:hypothetical protein